MAKIGTLEAQLVRGHDDDPSRRDQRTDDAEEPWALDPVDHR